MKRLFKWLLRLFLLIVVLVVLLLVFKDSILRAIIEQRVRDRTGMDVKIGKLSSSLFSPVFTLENVKVYNPAEFGGTPFLDIQELHLEFSPGELAQRNVRVTLARLNLAELDVVRNEAGQTNIVTILDRVKLRTKKFGGWKKVFGDFQFTGVEVLNLTIARVRYVDLKNPGNSSEVAPRVQNRVFRDLYTNVDVSTNLIVLWLECGGKLPISINEIISLAQKREKNPARTPAPPPNAPTAPTNSPPRH